MSEQDKNKKTVSNFIRVVFNDHEVDNGAERYLGSYYRQHNPDVADGREAFLDSFRAFFSEYPKSSFTVKRMIAERDLVAVHAHWKHRPEDRGFAVMDIFRLEDGRIVEHWDAVQPVPEHIAHSNTMF